MGLMSMVSKSMIGKKVVVKLGNGVAKGIEINGVLRGYSISADTIELEREGVVYTCDDIDLIEEVEEVVLGSSDSQIFKVYRIEVKKQHIDYDDFTAIVVVAESPEQARSDACCYVSNHGYQDNQENAKCFLYPEKSTIKELPFTRGIIAAEDLNG